MATFVAGIILYLPLCIAVAKPGNDGEDERRYGYFCKGEFVSLIPNSQLVSVNRTMSSLSTFVRDNSLTRDALSDHRVLKERDLLLYRRAVPEKEGAVGANLVSSAKSHAQGVADIVQPVFELGSAVLIPSDEVVVGFEEDTNLAEAKAYQNQYASDQGIVDIRSHRKNTYILRIDNPSDGRCYQVCQLISKLDGISFAEPNHIVIMLNQSFDAENTRSRLKRTIEHAPLPVSPPADLTSVAAPVALGAPSWTTLGTLDCESPTFPPAGWSAEVDIGKKDAYWGRTDYRSHSGSYSTYCALEGSKGVAPPGPCPKRMKAYLNSPLYNLTGYEEVYIEVWFYAKNELFPDPDGTLYDYCTVFVVDNSTGYGVGLGLATYASSDCTTDPTTDNGWRRTLLRVPQDYMVSNAYFTFRYESDLSVQKEGCYLDDIRIVGTTDVDTEPLGNDALGARHWGLKNVGQIAGLGNDSNDMEVPEAWNEVTVSSDVVIAIVDEGVDLTHPDLNLVTGYDYDGTVGGHARGEHGTSCAGEAGAIRDNSIGVIGTAPNVKIMPVYSGSSWPSDYADAIDVAVANGADILSNSWGINGAPSTDLENAVNDALSAGKVVLFAAGNGPDRSPWNYNVFFPGKLTGTTDVICVGASSPTDEHKSVSSSDGEHWWGSSYVGDGPDVCAPGMWSYTTDQQGTAGYNDGSDGSDPDYLHDFGGTSSSTPKVAGIVALLLSVNNSLTPGEVKQILQGSSDDIDDPGVDDKTGAGRVNAHNAVLTAIPASTDTPTVTETYTPTPTDTFTVTETCTPTPTDTSTATSTSAPSNTSTPTDTSTATNTPTGTSSSTATSTSTATPTPHDCSGFDVNGDDAVGFLDLSSFSIAYGSSCGDPEYRDGFDSNNDCTIDFADLSSLSVCYGTSW